MLQYQERDWWENVETGQVEEIELNAARGKSCLHD
jgi:hypothetical protein